MIPLRAFLLALIASLPALVQAADAAGEKILARLKQARPDLDFADPKPSPVQGLYEVQVANGPIIYVSADGGYFFAGDLFAVQDGGFVNLGEQQRQAERRELIAAVNPQDMIIFAPDDVKATLTVFTDVDCGYCRKLHNEVPELNKMGIAVHYLAFPRAGVGSPSYRKIATAWCADNRQETLTRLKNGESLPEKVCEGNPVAEQMLLGERVGVSGTPALVLEDGTLLPGYRPAKQLAHILGVE